MVRMMCNIDIRKKQIVSDGSYLGGARKRVQDALIKTAWSGLLSS